MMRSVGSSIATAALLLASSAGADPLTEPGSEAESETAAGLETAAEPEPEAEESTAETAYDPTSLPPHPAYEMNEDMRAMLEYSRTTDVSTCDTHGPNDLRCRKAMDQAAADHLATGSYQRLVGWILGPTGLVMGVVGAGLMAGGAPKNGSGGSDAMLGTGAVLILGGVGLLIPGAVMLGVGYGKTGRGEDFVDKARIGIRTGAQSFGVVVEGAF